MRKARNESIMFRVDDNGVLILRCCPFCASTHSRAPTAPESQVEHLLLVPLECARNMVVVVL